MDKKGIATGIILALVASAVILGTGRVLYGWDPGVTSQYALSEGMSKLLGWGSCLAGASILLLLARSSLTAFAASVLVLPIPIFFAIFSELIANPTSHNLIPIEIAIYSIGSTLLHIPALIGWFLFGKKTATSDLLLQLDGPSGRRLSPKSSSGQINRDEFQESWRRTTAHLEAAAALLPEPLAGDGSCESLENYREFISVNELELALEQLDGLGGSNSVPRAFWDALARAAREMGLAELAQEYEDAV